MLDLRNPIGAFFSATGLIVALTGIFSRYRAPLEFANVNLYCGASMLVFGLFMLWLARRRS